MEKFSSAEELLYYCGRDKKVLIDFFKNPDSLPNEIEEKVKIIQKNAPLIPGALDIERKKLEKIDHLMKEISYSLEDLKFSIEKKVLRLFNQKDQAAFSSPIKKTLGELIDIQKKLQNEIEENIIFLELIESYLKSK